MNANRGGGMEFRGYGRIMQFGNSEGKEGGGGGVKIWKASVE